MMELFCKNSERLKPFVSCSISFYLHQGKECLIKLEICTKMKFSIQDFFSKCDQTLFGHIY